MARHGARERARAPAGLDERDVTSKPRAARSPVQYCSVYDVLYCTTYTVLYILYYIYLSRGLYRGNFIKIVVKLWTKIGQNWVMVSSWASLDGLAVLSLSDMVYIVLYTVLHILK